MISDKALVDLQERAEESLNKIPKTAEFTGERMYIQTRAHKHAD